MAPGSLYPPVPPRPAPFFPFPSFFSPCSILPRLYEKVCPSADFFDRLQGPLLVNPERPLQISFSFYDAKPNKRLADGGLLLRLHLLDVASLGIAGICDKPVLPLGLRDAGAVDVEAVLFLYPSANLLVGRHFCFRIEFALVVVCVDYEGEPGSVHRQTGFGNGVRIPNVCPATTKSLFS